MSNFRTLRAKPRPLDAGKGGTFSVRQSVAPNEEMKRTPLKRRTPLRARKDSIPAKHWAYFLEHCIFHPASGVKPNCEHRRSTDYLVARNGSWGGVFKAWFYDGALRDGNGQIIYSSILEWAERVPLPGRYGVSKRRAAILPGEQTARSFGSGWEAGRATYLRLRELAGEITWLEHQKTFHLRHPALDGLDITYTSDASYIEDGRLVIEDTKGEETERFKWICRLWPWLGPAELRIVKKGRSGWCVRTIHVKLTGKDT